MKFSINGTISINEHLISFSTACHNIGENDHNTCMCLFVKYLEGVVIVDLFYFPPKTISTWDKLSYWFKSTSKQPQRPTDKCK